MDNATRIEIITLAARRAVALNHALGKKGLTPENFIVPTPIYETGEEYLYFQQATKDPTMAVFDYECHRFYTAMVTWGMERKGWRTQPVAIRRAEFEAKKTEAEAIPLDKKSL